MDKQQRLIIFSPNTNYTVARVNSPGDFASQRYGYFHPGIDIYCPDETIIHAYEDGVVVNICEFTGQHADPVSPWWNDTRSVLIEGKSGVIGYCELEPLPNISIGQIVAAGTPIGKVIPVLKEDKGNGTTMLHLEFYKPGTKNHADWRDNKPQPDELLNPRTLLIH